MPILSTVKAGNAAIGERRRIVSERIVLLLVWCLLMVCTTATIAVVQFHSQTARLEEETSSLHRLISQRVDQHDAHMTALSAVAVSAGVGAGAGAGQADLFLDVISTISRFYPRIDEVHLVPLDPRRNTIGSADPSPGLVNMIRQLALNLDDRIALVVHPERPNHYLMIKRSPNSAEARNGLALAIDANALVDDAGLFWTRPGTTLGLSMPSGTRLTAGSHAINSLRFSRALSSASQPLQLETGMQLRLADLLPLSTTMLTSIAVSLAFVATIVIQRQRRRTRAALEKAQLSALEARFSHASRINTLGEMASGLVHELTQPLTAILAQAQAARRLLDLGTNDPLRSVLDDTITQARRAASLLERFRNWSRPQKKTTSLFDSRDTLVNVRMLLGPEADRQGIVLTFDVPDLPVPIVADPVEMEQVVFNLIRNAIDATAGLREGTIAVSLRQNGECIVLEIADNGPGIAEGIRLRLFTPFVTTREGGTGLGLALSQRLVENARGDITLVSSEAGRTIFRVTLPHGQVTVATC